ncbi:hypothetical protein GF377_04240 [candidate division GN15 bacterium]|nr:hypothetical protein [candidate division GN15 bacterium]
MQKPTTHRKWRSPVVLTPATLVWPLVLGLLLCQLLVESSTAAPRDLIIEIQTAPSAYHDTELPDKLRSAFSRNEDYRTQVYATDSSGIDPPFPSARTNPDSLLNWGMEVGGRYLLSITVDDVWLERRKTFNIPLLFHRYQTIGVIEGELRLLDLSKGRLLAAEPIRVEMAAKDQFQAEFDDNRHSSGLKISAPAKSRFFSELEDRLVRQLVERVHRAIQGR